VGGSSLLREGSSWSEAMAWQGRRSRSMLNYGSPFHRVAGIVAVDAASLSSSDRPLTLSVDSWSSEPVGLTVNVYRGRRVVASGALSPRVGTWSTADFDVPAGEDVGTRGAFQPSDSGTFGTGDIVIRDVEFVDGSGAATYVLRHGAPATLTVHYEILNPSLAEHAQVTIGFHRDGVQDVCRYIARDLNFDASHARGVARLDIPGLSLTDGIYTVSIMIAKEGYYDREQATFYSINPSGRTMHLNVRIARSQTGMERFAAATGVLLLSPMPLLWYGAGPGPGSSNTVTSSGISLMVGILYSPRLNVEICPSAASNSSISE